MSIVTVEKARSRLGLAATANHRDVEIQDLLNAAEAHVEDLSGYILEGRQIQVALIPACGMAEIFAWPIARVDAISYLDDQGAVQAADVSDLRILQNHRPARILVGEGSWPSDYYSNGQATVTAGFDLLADVPPKLVQAVLILVGQWFEDPDGERAISTQVKSLCYAFRTAI